MVVRRAARCVAGWAAEATTSSSTRPKMEERAGAPNKDVAPVSEERRLETSSSSSTARKLRVAEREAPARCLAKTSTPPRQRIRDPVRNPQEKAIKNWATREHHPPTPRRCARRTRKNLPKGRTRRAKRTRERHAQNAQFAALRVKARLPYALFTVSTAPTTRSDGKGRTVQVAKRSGPCSPTKSEQRPWNSFGEATR